MADGEEAEATDELARELQKYFTTPEGKQELRKAYRDEINGKQPRLWEAIWADCAIYSGMLMEEPRFKTVLGCIVESIRLAWTSDAYFAMLLYRLRTWFHVRKIPFFPRVLHRLSVMISQLCIGDWVVLHPGVYFPHGFVVIDGAVEIGRGSVVAPWVSIGRNGAALEGPCIGEQTFIGTGAKLIGPIRVGSHVIVAANSVVVSDVAAHTTVAGAPARLVKDRREA